jgi:hypothetical protein
MAGCLTDQLTRRALTGPFFPVAPQKHYGHKAPEDVAAIKVRGTDTTIHTH